MISTANLFVFPILLLTADLPSSPQPPVARPDEKGYHTNHAEHQVDEPVEKTTSRRIVFAAPASFPLRDFGPNGEVIDRPGAVIYEDMVFSFDRNGNYNLRFTIETPAMPTNVYLQMLVQPCKGRPWYTITLAPIEFRPEKGKLVRNHVVEGHSEILHRCFKEMGKSTTIRRAGSARFGYGREARRQATAY
ncbi:MAG: hypothetical protein H8E44_28410 [Planctomycetes bacterium]|nr:hypothetical protein [Planctomycetota bacterium]MBL7039214.1 hypothetical protein [Pirellulaceae bacterium]